MTCQHNVKTCLFSGIPEKTRVRKCPGASEWSKQQPERRSPRVGELGPVSLLEVTPRGLGHRQPQAEEGLTEQECGLQRHGHREGGREGRHQEAEEQEHRPPQRVPGTKSSWAWRLFLAPS